MQPQVHAPILALGVFQPAGFVGSMGILAVLQGGLLTALLMRNRGRPSAEVPANCALAVTDAAVYMFELTPTSKLKRPLRAWGRDGLKVTAQKKALTYRVCFPYGVGTDMELECVRRGGDRYHDEVIRLLTEPTTA